MMTKKILFLLTFLLTTIGGGNLFAADETFAVSCTSGGSTINGTDWGSGNVTLSSATASVGLTIGGGSDNWNLGSNIITGKNKSASLTFQANKNGLLVINLTKNSGGNKYLTIKRNGSEQEVKSVVVNNNTTISYNSSKQGYNIEPTSCPIEVSIDAEAGVSYTIDFSAFNDWSFSSFTFTPAETTINISDLNYSVGPAGKSDAGLNRTVGGFDLSFTNGGSGQGIKFNGGSSFFFRTGANGTMTIAMDGNNSSISITKIVLTISANIPTDQTENYNNPASYFGVNTGSLTKNSDTQLIWTGSANSVTFTHPSASVDVDLSRIVITTTTTPSFTKITPTLSPSSASIKVGTVGTYSPTTTSTPANFAWTWSHTDLTSTNVTYAVGNANSSDVGDAGSFTTTASSVAGTYAMSATFNGSSNPWFNSATISDAYTLTVASAVLSTPDATVQTYPYTWNFANGSSTWGNSSTQLPASDWEETDTDTYYHYNVPNTETGFNIDAIKGLRFQNINWLGLDWGYGHIWSTAGTITIPNVPTGMTIQIVAQNRNDSNPATTITPTNATYTGEGTATLGTEYTTYTFTKTATGTDVSFEFSGKSSIRSIAVVQTANPHKWNFEDPNYWTTTSGQLNASYWVESADATNNQGEVMSNVAFSGEELTKDGTNVLPETQGLLMTAVKGSSRFNIGKYYRLGNRSKASITIPYATTGQTVTFKVETATAGMERGITAASSNLELISGQVSDKISFFTYRVTSDGDAVFRQTSDDAGLKIYYIDLKAATPAASELKFVDSEGHDISNTHVSIKSGTSGNLDKYFKLSKSGGPAWTNIPVTFNGGIISCDNPSSWEGSFTLGNSTGEATILARTVESSTETGIAVLYVSVKNQPTVTLNYTEAPPYSVDYGQDFNGGTSTVKGTSNAGLTVKYKSSNERVATVNANGHVTCVGVGTATITAYTEETTDYLYAEASYNLTINQGNVVFRFEPSEIDLPLGKTITPYMNYDQQGQIDTNGLSFTVSKDGVVNTEKVASPREPDKYLCKITSIDDASLVGESVIITAQGQVKGSDPAVYHYTTIKVNITAADACNFDWVNSSDIYIYEDTYLPIPRIAGNATGNNHFSNSDKNGGNGDENGKNNKTESGKNYKYYWEGDNHYDPLHAYVYEIKKDVITWNNNSLGNTNYHLNEGVPDFYLTDASNAATDNGYILWAKPSNSAYGDTLLVYAKTEGIIKLHAKDSQNDTECTPITIHIMPKSTIYGSKGELETQIKTISFPYTWDFTSNEDLSALDNSIYWEKENNNYYNAPLTMNVNFADGQNSGLTNAKTHLAFLGATSNGGDHHILPWFKGLKIQLGNSTYDSKIHKIRISPYTSPGNSRLYLSGGTHTITLPQPGYHNPATGFYEPESYKVFIKLHTTGSTEVELKAGVSNDSYKSFDKEGATYTKIDANSDVILSKTVARGEQVSIGLADCNIYWIAMSTESNSTAKHSANKTLTYAATSYSYGKALDLAKSEEVNNGLTAYYAKTFTNGQDVAAAVTLRQVTLNRYSVPANTGLVLKSNEPSTNYMIADAENKDSYTAPVALPENFLVAGDGDESVVNSTTGSGEGIKTNFILSWAYKQFADDGTTAMTGYLYDRDWSFYKVMPSAEVPVGKAYLQVNGNLRVKPDGTIETVKSASSRRAADGSNDDRPANKLMLDIVYEDEAHGFDATTAINDVKTDTVTVDDDAWYTIQGVRVNTPARGGIYIHNGRKVVIK